MRHEALCLLRYFAEKLLFYELFNEFLVPKNYENDRIVDLKHAFLSVAPTF